VKAFNIAETYQIPVVLLSDQFLGGHTEILEPCRLDTLNVAWRRLAADLGAAPYLRFAACG
jgi:pyruvate/2-oxoacid:ferredoxin oxidoreductase alpha subunit